MLHIILGILKIAGIVIGLLFVILLCTLLALLLVPVRYRVGAVKQGEKQQLNIGLSWMLRMVSVTVSGGRKEKPVVLIRLFGIRLPFFDGKRPKKDRHRRTEKSGQKESVFREQGQKSPEEESVSVHEREGYGNGRLPDYGEGDLTHSGTDEHMDDEPSDEKPDLSDTRGSSDAGPALCKEQKLLKEKQHFSASQKPDRAPEPEKTERTSRAGARPRAFRSWLRRCSAAVRRIPGRLTSLKKKMKALWKKLLSLREKPAQIKKTFHRFYEKPSAFFRMIEEYEIKEIFGSLYGEALYLLGHYKPRRIRGYLRFGAGDPALTGWLTGVIYLILPARADQFSVMPDFYETIFETEAIFTGYVRSVHLIRTVLHVFRDERVRRVFQREEN